MKETIVKIPKDVWKKDKSRAYGLPCSSMAGGNDFQTIGDLTSAMELTD
jgi:hypothetical protein